MCTLMNGNDKIQAEAQSPKECYMTKLANVDTACSTDGKEVK